MRAGLVAVLLSAMAGAAFAEDTAPAANAAEARYTTAYQKCLDSPEGQSTAGMIGCIGAELEVQDARLNAQYRKAMADLNPRQKARLQAAERAWLAYRDAECLSYTDEDWGSLSRINANHCVLQMTVERLIALENYPPE
ncbi:MAG TPA: lysozyme inhibitor LprI family protein [Caulobacteraceae bacterium]|jgi:uncharacterized protein YecT (DUF1311 family)|nr:lysozyme inhibitor LprI family protein [Caulobacteraceae bacterium]